MNVQSIGYADNAYETESPIKNYAYSKNVHSDYTRNHNRFESGAPNFLTSDSFTSTYHHQEHREKEQYDIYGPTSVKKKSTLGCVIKGALLGGVVGGVLNGIFKLF